MGQVGRHNRDRQRIRELEAELRSLRKQLCEKDEVIDILKNPLASCPNHRGETLLRPDAALSGNPCGARQAGSWRSHAAAAMAGRATTPVRGSGAIRRFGADWRSRARSAPPWDWTASIICSSRNWDVPASGFTDSYGLPGSSRGDAEPAKSPPTPGTVTLLHRTFCNESSLSTRQIKPG